jgi:hypothetical protein
MVWARSLRSCQVDQLAKLVEIVDNLALPA